MRYIITIFKDQNILQMKKYLLALIISMFIPLSVLNSQVSVDVSKSDFKLEDEGFKDAWKNIKEGDQLFKSGEGLYPEAIECYLLANEYNGNNAELNYKIGISYLFGSEPLKSLDYLLKAYELKPDVTHDILLLTGRSYQYRGDYGKAIDCYNMYSDKYVSTDSFNPEVNNLLNQCIMAIEMAGMESSSEIFNAGMNINSEYDDYSPVISNEGMLLYFTTRRIIGENRDRQDSDMKWDENIYVSTRDGDGWSPAGPAGEKLSTVLNEGVLSVVANGQLMYIYAGYEGNGDILQSEFLRGKWNTPVQSEMNLNSKYRETSISLTEDGNEIFFTSDKRKNVGGRDIYFIKRVRRNKWTKPYNLGDPVNTEYNEESVCVSPDGDTIWFSSNRPGGMGGYDIYMSVKDEIGLWSDPVNIGIPANSQSNDLFYNPVVHGRNEAWLASDRPGGYGGFDIYIMNINHAIDSLAKTKADTLSIEIDTARIKIDTLGIYRK